jgi:Tfp pilus assembly protein PilO
MTQTNKWSLMAAVLAMAILAAGWFLLVSPTRGEAASLRTDTAKEEQANAQLLLTLNELKSLAPELPKREAELAAIRRQIPDNPALPALIRQLTATAKKSQADLVTLTPGTPVALVVEAATPTAPGAAPTTADQLMQVPLALKVTGSFSELQDFVDRLEGLRRVFLTTAFTLAPQGEGGAMDLSVTGRVYMVAAAPATTAPVAGGTTGTTTSSGATSGTSPAAPAN